MITGTALENCYFSSFCKNDFSRSHIYKATRQIRRKEQSWLSYRYKSALSSKLLMSVKGTISLTRVISAKNFRRVVREIEGYTRKFAKTLCVKWITLGQ